MVDYVYQVRAYVDVSICPRGTGSSTLGPSGPPSSGTVSSVTFSASPTGYGYSESNVPGFGTTGTPGILPMAQTKRFQAAEMVPNAIGTAPTAANIGTAISSAATDIQGQITTAVLAQIVGWAT